MSRSPGEVEAALERAGQSGLDVWLDPLSPATSVLLPVLDLDGRPHDGRPWRFRGRDAVGLHLLPEDDDPVAGLAARCVLAVRAWAVLREADDPIVTMGYELPWTYLAGVQQDPAAVRTHGLAHLAALAARDGDWLGDWVVEWHDAAPVTAALERDRRQAHALGLTVAPCVVAGTLRFSPEDLPDDLHEVIAKELDAWGAAP